MLRRKDKAHHFSSRPKRRIFSKNATFDRARPSRLKRSQIPRVSIHQTARVEPRAFPRARMRSEAKPRYFDRPSRPIISRKKLPFFFLKKVQPVARNSTGSLLDVRTRVFSLRAPNDSREHFGTRKKRRNETTRRLVFFKAPNKRRIFRAFRSAKSSPLFFFIVLASWVVGPTHAKRKRGRKGVSFLFFVKGALCRV